MSTFNDNMVHPEDSSNMQYWTKKWDISLGELSDAILNTGSLQAPELTAYLRRHMMRPSLWHSLLNHFRFIQ